jgi:hypothetical protein
MAYLADDGSVEVLSIDGLPEGAPLQLACGPRHRCLVAIADVGTGEVLRFASEDAVAGPWTPASSDAAFPVAGGAMGPLPTHGAVRHDHVDGALLVSHDDGATWFPDASLMDALGAGGASAGVDTPAGAPDVEGAQGERVESTLPSKRIAVLVDDDLARLRAVMDLDSLLFGYRPAGVDLGELETVLRTSAAMGPLYPRAFRAADARAEAVAEGLNRGLEAPVREGVRAAIRGGGAEPAAVVFHERADPRMFSRLRVPGGAVVERLLVRPMHWGGGESDAAVGLDLGFSRLRVAIEVRRFEGVGPPFREAARQQVIVLVDAPPLAPRNALRHAWRAEGLLALRQGVSEAVAAAVGLAMHPPSGLDEAAAAGPRHVDIVTGSGLERLWASVVEQRDGTLLLLLPEGQLLQMRGRLLEQVQADDAGPAPDAPPAVAARGTALAPSRPMRGDLAAPMTGMSR